MFKLNVIATKNENKDKSRQNICFSSKFSIFYQVYVIMNTIKINVMSVILHEQIFCNKAGIGNHLHSRRLTDPFIFPKTRQI